MTRVKEHFEDKCVVLCNDKCREHFDARVTEQYDEMCNGIFC